MDFNQKGMKHFIEEVVFWVALFALPISFILIVTEHTGITDFVINSAIDHLTYGEI